MKHGDSKKTGRIKSRLSFSGWIYVLLCLLVGLAAVNSNNNVLFLITSLLLSLLLLSGLCALYNVSGIRVQAVGRNILTPGEPGTLMFRVKNRKRFSALVLEIGLENDKAIIPVMGPGKQKDVFLSWNPPHRGKPVLPPVSVTSSFPFGFIRRGGFLAAGTGPVVAPKPLGRIPENMSARDQEQQTINTPGQGSGEWQGIRQYRPGESKAAIVWRRLDWHRQGMDTHGSRWPAHSFAPENSPSLVLDWNDPLYAHLDTEKRLSLMRSILDRAADEHRSWELKLPGQQVSGQAGANHLRALEALALVQPLPG